MWLFLDFSEKLLALSVKDEFLSAKVAKNTDNAQVYRTKSVFKGSFCYFYDKSEPKYFLFQKEIVSVLYYCNSIFFPALMYKPLMGCFSGRPHKS